METRLNCQFCLVNPSKYSCPRCHLSYCSVSCYQSNSHLECSEIFYKEWVQEEMRNHQADPEAQKRIFEILRENQTISDESLDSDDEEDVPDLASRMANVNLDDEEAVWEKLTPEERQEFRKLVSTGSIVQILPDWEPWWRTKPGKIQVIDCDDENYDWKSKCPTVPSDIPELLKLTKVEPSPYVACMLLNVLLSYAFTVRWLRGAHDVLPVEAISMCISLSATLRNNKVLKTALEAFMAFEKDLSQCHWVKDGNHTDTTRKDVVDIINGSDGDDLFFCLKAAISDLNSLCSQALTVIKKGKNNHLKRFSGPPPTLSLLQQISRKMNYYLSWTTSHGGLLHNIL